MASIGKKILSAFVEIADEEKTSSAKPVESTQLHANIGQAYIPSVENAAKFTQYFGKLFNDANIPGPDYFEFSKMIEAMSSIPDEKARYSAAFAGLNVQGLNKQKLLSTAAEYLRILNADAASFDSTVDAALRERVHAKQKEIGEKTNRIEQLSREINDLHQQIAALNREVKENEEKIESNSGSYKTASEKMKTRIMDDIEKIKQYIH